MKIATRLSIAALIPFLIVIVMTSGAVVMYRHGKTAQEHSRLTTRIVDSVSELSILANTYLLHYNSRSKEQFLLMHAEVVTLFDSIELKGEEKRLAQSIRADLDAMKVLFLRVVDLHEKQGEGDHHFSTVVLKRLGGQLQTRASRLASASSKLALTVNGKTAAAQNRANLIIILVTSGGALGLLVFLMRSIRYLTASLTSLHRGMERFASGNLDHRVGTDAGDELGDLARAFDRMTRQLRALTVSRDVLNREIEEKERTEKALRKSEERFRKVFEEGPLGMLMVDREFRIRNVNSRFCQMLGYGEAELCALTTSDITHPDDLAEAKLLNDRLREGAVHHYTSTKRYLRKDGSALWVNLTATMVKSDDSTPLYYLGMVQDITERKRAEDALFNRERLLKAVMESVPVGIIVRDVDNSLLFVNETARSIHGSDLNPVAFGPDAGALLLPDGASFPHEKLPLARALTLGITTRDAEIMLRGADGKERTLLAAASPILDASGNVTSGVAVVQDITGRKRMEEALKKAHDELEQRVAERTEELASAINLLTEEIEERQKAEEKIRRINRLYAVLSETNQAIVRASDQESLFREFCRIAVNEGGFTYAWIGLLGSGSRLEPVASNGVAIVHQETPPDGCSAGSGPAERAARSGSFHICKHLARSGCGDAPAGDESSAGACASVPIQGENGVIGALTLYGESPDIFDRQHIELLQQMGRDISFGVVYLEREAQRRRAEQALQGEILERLQVVEALREQERMLIQQSRLAAMGEMISNIAHQWRQPLNVLGLLIQELQLVHQVHGGFRPGYLEEKVKKSQEVIFHMSGTIDDFRNFFRPEKQKVAFRVSEALARTLSLVEGSLKNDRIEVEVRVTGEPTVVGYPNEFGQVLVNILSNARDAFLQRRVASPRVVTITLAAREERAVITIADNAGGIPEEIIAKVFDPYFTTKGPEVGTGIGLFMSKTIIEKNMQGRLTACNSGEGAVFTIEL